jgi:hypothetical protein
LEGCAHASKAEGASTGGGVEGVGRWRIARLRQASFRPVLIWRARARVPGQPGESGYDEHACALVDEWIKSVKLPNQALGGKSNLVEELTHAHSWVRHGCNTQQAHKPPRLSTQNMYITRQGRQQLGAALHPRNRTRGAGHRQAKPPGTQQPLCCERNWPRGHFATTGAVPSSISRLSRPTVLSFHRPGEP